MNRDPDFLRAEALTTTEFIALPAELVGAAKQPASAKQSVAAEVAMLLGFADGGAVPLVLRTGETTARRAEALLPLHGEHIGRRIALLPLTNADISWLVIGLLADQPVEQSPVSAVDVQTDGQRLTLQARNELTLRCGKSSVKLRADGRVEIRGETIISEAVRANRVRGGSVELN